MTEMGYEGRPTAFARRIGLTKDAIADWRTNRDLEPRNDSLERLARAFDMTMDDARDLFPALDKNRPVIAPARLACWTRQDAIPQRTWRDALDAATRLVWVLDYAPTTLLAAVPDLTDRLTRLAQDTADVRVAIAAPGASIVDHLNRHVHHADRYAHRVQRAHDQLAPLRDGDHLREFRVHLPTAITRIDDTWWTPTAIYGQPPEAWPVLTYTTTQRPNLAGIHTTAFQAAWRHATQPRH